MSETRFTPGPWSALWSKYDEGVVIVQAGMPSMRVLARFDGDGDGPDEQSLADAHLIAAAPELYAALCLAHDHLAVQYEDFDGEPTGPLVEIRNALSKARGERS